MLHTWPTVRTVATGQYLGALSYLVPLVRRSNWLYGQAHGLNHLFRQTWGVTTGATTVWEGETYYRTEHPTLNFTGRINLSAGGAAQLQYYGDDSAWHDMPSNGSDVNTGDRWFCATESLTYNCSALSLPTDGMLHLRLIIAIGQGAVYRAYMSGTSFLWPEVGGALAWPTLPTFGAGAPSAADFNALRQAGAYLLECAKHPDVGSGVGTATHTQPGASAYQALFRYSFIYSGTQRLYVNLTISENEAAGEHVIIYLQSENWISGGRIATLADLEANESDTGHNIDVSGLGLTLGTRYCVEIGATKVADETCPIVHVNNIVMADQGTPTRTNMPVSVWAEGNQPTAAQLNAIVNDLNQMYPASDRESPIWTDHPLATFQPTLVGDTGTLQFSVKRFRLVHRWRYLRWRGVGKIASAQRNADLTPVNEHSLSDTSPAGEAQVLDLETVTWLAYGMEYWVESYGSNECLVAQEDYSA